MRTYKEFISLLEQPSGGRLMVTRRFGSSGLGGSTAVTGSVQGGKPTGTQYSATGTVGSGTVSGQGDKINKGISASISNTQSGGGGTKWQGVPYRTPNADTSTSSIRKGAFGSLSANASGGGVRTASKPEPPKPPSKPPQNKEKSQPPTAVRKQEKTTTRVEPDDGRAPTEKPATPSLTARGYTDDRNNPYPGSIERAGQLASDSPNAAVRAQAAQDYQAMRGLQTQFKNERLARSTGVKPVVKRADGTYGVQ
jgi:hypothetical protein